MLLRIVPVENIPIEVKEVDLKNLFKVYKICTQLREVCNIELGVGISAVQCGIAQKLFLIKFPDGYEYFANCEYNPVGDQKILHLEGCLSLRTPKGKLRTFEVERHAEITLSGCKIKVDQSSLVLEKFVDYHVAGFYAAVFQHEIDHQNRILISDIGKEIELY